MYICIDFDGTVVEHEYPAIGAPVPGALRAMRRLHGEGHRLILHTMRSGQTLLDAVNYLGSNGIRLFGVNENPTQKSWTESPKVYGNVYIDDAAAGCPLKIPQDGRRPYVDWVAIENWLVSRGILTTPEQPELPAK